jgi:hypothetical protein
MMQLIFLLSCKLLLGCIDKILEGLLIMNSNFRKHLSVHVDISELQSVHQLGIAEIIHVCMLH